MSFVPKRLDYLLLYKDLLVEAKSFPSPRVRRSIQRNIQESFRFRRSFLEQVPQSKHRYYFQGEHALTLLRALRRLPEEEFFELFPKSNPLEVVRD